MLDLRARLKNGGPTIAKRELISRVCDIGLHPCVEYYGALGLRRQRRRRERNRERYGRNGYLFAHAAADSLGASPDVDVRRIITRARIDVIRCGAGLPFWLSAIAIIEAVLQIRIWTGRPRDEVDDIAWVGGQR